MSIASSLTELEEVVLMRMTQQPVCGCFNAQVVLHPAELSSGRSDMAQLEEPVEIAQHPLGNAPSYLL